MFAQSSPDTDLKDVCIRSIRSSPIWSRRDDDAGADYYRHWRTALETLLRNKGVATRESLERHRTAWQHATQRTPHGQPILLTAEDFSDQLPEVD
jgi:hypothetical protein